MGQPAGLPRIALPPRIDAAAFGARLAGRPVTILSGQTMGTGWQVTCVLPAAVPVDVVRAVVEQKLAMLVAQMSHWQADSDLCRFNRAAAGTWVALPADFARVMQAGLAIAGASDGAFSPATGRMVDAWGHGPPGPVPYPPAPAVIAATCAASDWRRLAFEPDTGRLRQPGGLSLDLSGIAKGYAVDAVAGALAGMGIAHHLVEIGGELRGAGVRPDGQPWWVDLETPPATGLPPLRVALHALGVATSGSYVRGAHTIDPRMGQPASHGVIACSVLHDSAMIADAWASALTVVGGAAGMALATRMDLAVRWIEAGVEGWRERLSPALAGMLAE